MLYPCVVSCSDPHAGALDIEARAQRPETVTVRNTSGAAIELYGYQLTLPGSSWPFPENAVVPAGGTYQVDVAEWDNGRYLLPDPGGWIRLRPSPRSRWRVTRGGRGRVRSGFRSTTRQSTPAATSAAFGVRLGAPGEHLEAGGVGDGDGLGDRAPLAEEALDVDADDVGAEVDGGGDRLAEREAHPRQEADRYRRAPGRAPSAAPPGRSS